eukprot:jgi/Galph1/4061/GphlegSOOS_G2784.1
MARACTFSVPTIFSTPFALELYRKLLNNARNLPDPVVRSYVTYQTKRLFRERQFEYGQDNLTKYFKQGRYALRVVRRAVGGEAKAFGRLVELAYCVKGRGKHELGIEDAIKKNNAAKTKKKNAKVFVSEPYLLPEPLQRVIERQMTVLPRSLRRVYRLVIGFDDVLVRLKYQNQEKSSENEAQVTKVGRMGSLHIYKENRFPEQFVYERTLQAYGAQQIAEASSKVKKIPPWLTPFFVQTKQEK